jgi:hypothetical protein
MGKTSNTHRGGTVRGLWKMAPTDTEPVPVPSIGMLLDISLYDQPHMRYMARESKQRQFPGEWRAEPVNYRGRGIIYFFCGEDAKFDAERFVKEKNLRDGFK